MGVKTALILCTSLSILILQLLIFTANADEALIKKLCDANPLPAACQGCLKSNPSSKTANKTGLAMNSLACVATELNILSNNTYDYQQRTTDRNMKFALGVCLSWRFELKDYYIGFVSETIRNGGIEFARNMTEFGIRDPVSSCASFIKSKGLQVPDIVSKGIADVARECLILMGILVSIK